MSTYTWTVDKLWYNITMVTRTAPLELESLARMALVEALQVAGVTAKRGPKKDGGALVVQRPGGGRMTLQVKAASRVDPRQARHYVENQSSSSGLLVVVADALTQEAQDELREAGVGFLDRRGHLYLRKGALHLDLDVLPDPRISQTRSDNPIRGRAGITVAAALLLAADESVGVRELARRTSLPVSTTSKALVPIRNAALLDNGQALIPDLFWALADAWNPARIPLSERPPDDTGILSGTVAAAELGAPVVVAADSPPDLYVSDATEVRSLERRHGTTSGSSRKASVAVQPTPLVTETATNNVAHPLFVALDLAQDRSRGREILDVWNPTEVQRVW